MEILTDMSLRHLNLSGLLGASLSCHVNYVGQPSCACRFWALVSGAVGSLVCPVASSTKSEGVRGTVVHCWPSIAQPA